MKKKFNMKRMGVLLATIAYAISSVFLLSACELIDILGGTSDGTSENTSVSGGATDSTTNSTTDSGSGVGEKTYTVATRRAAPEKVYTLKFENAMGKDVMPVGSYAGPYASERVYHGKVQPSMVSKEYFDLYERMGLNFFTATLTDKDAKIQDFLTLCDEYDMGAFVTFGDLNGEGQADFVSSDAVEKNLDKFVDDHKSLLGFYLRDEPTGAVIDKIQKTTDALHNSYYRRDMYAYVNALPEWATGHAGFSTWEEYLEAYCEQLRPGFLSFDFYPWYLNPSDGSVVYRSGYIKNLSIAKKVADKHQIPLWSCKQCGAYQEYIPLEKEKFIPGENEFRWQMSIDLAYGVKGYTYFLLCGANLGYDGVWEEGIDDYFGLFNAYTGQPNRWFYYAEEFDKHLTNIESVLINAAHEGVILSGNVREANYVKSAGNGEWIESGAYHELESVSSESGAWTGCYNYDGQTVLYVVNDSCEKNNTVTLNFNDNYGYTVYQKEDVTDRTGKALTLNLLPGEGAMVTLKYE